MLSVDLCQENSSATVTDLIRHALSFQEGDVEAAQENKSKLEQLQRADQALRIAGRKTGECC